jgi:hypothetical protein
MRKIIGGVSFNQASQSEWYFISIKNENDTYENLLYERFDRKKSYGLEYVIEKANQIFLERIELPLSEEEVNWFTTLDPIQLQTEILAAAPTGEE